MGTTILAINTISARSQEPSCQSSITPPKIVWALLPKMLRSSMTGRILAGI
mgnify:CR=1 FL=1